MPSLNPITELREAMRKRDLDAHLRSHTAEARGTHTLGGKMGPQLNVPQYADSVIRKPRKKKGGHLFSAASNIGKTFFPSAAEAYDKYKSGYYDQFPNAPGPIYDALDDIFGSISMPEKGAVAATKLAGKFAATHGPAIAKTLGAASGGIAPALVALKGKVHPQAHVFRAMTSSNLDELLGAIGKKLPYETSGSIVSPGMMQTYTTPIGLMFDVPDEKAFRGVWSQDASTWFNMLPGGGKKLDRSASTLAPRKTGLNQLFRDQLASKGSVRGAGYNEAVFDASKANIAGVGLPSKRPEGPKAADYDRYMKYAREQKLPIYMMGEGAPKRVLPDEIMQDPTSGVWEKFKTKKLDLPIFRSSFRNIYGG